MAQHQCKQEGRIASLEKAVEDDRSLHERMDLKLDVLVHNQAGHMAVHKYGRWLVGIAVALMGAAAMVWQAIT